MLCKDCDYYHEISKDQSGISFCEFADMLFLDDVENLDVEYPCKEIDFDEYLQKESAGDAAAAKKYVKPELFRELKECGVCMLRFPDGMIKKCFQEQSRNSSALDPVSGVAQIRKR